MKNRIYKNIEILYEDNHLLVVVKPYGVLSQSDITGDKDMLSLLKEYIKEKYDKPGKVYLGLVHRLDRPTGGIMVFARTSKAAKRLSEQIKNKVFKKTYLCVIPNLTKKEGILIDYIAKREDGTSFITDEKNGKYAELEYKEIDKKDCLSLVKVSLLTGRHHQIRLQFKNINCPLYGESRYSNSKGKELALFAYKLDFIHPVTKENLVFTKYPDYGIFKLFYGGKNEK